LEYPEKGVIKVEEREKARKDAFGLGLQQGRYRRLGTRYPFYYILSE
jgi:hypothetical protein